MKKFVFCEGVDESWLTDSENEEYADDMTPYFDSGPYYLASEVDAEERKHVARIAELEKAMVDLVTSHNGYNKGLGPCICAAHEEARRVLGMTRDDAHPARSL